MKRNKSNIKESYEPNEYGYDIYYYFTNTNYEETEIALTIEDTENIKDILKYSDLELIVDSGLPWGHGKTRFVIEAIYCGEKMKLETILNVDYRTVKELLSDDLEDEGPLYDLLYNIYLDVFENSLASFVEEINELIEEEGNANENYTSESVNEELSDGFMWSIDGGELETAEDDYNEGIIGETYYSSVSNIKGRFYLLSETVKFISDRLYFRSISNVDAWVYLDGTLQSDVLVDENNMEANESEIERWKKGDMVLYNCHVVFPISIVRYEEREPTEEEVSAEGVEIYD